MQNMNAIDFSQVPTSLLWAVIKRGKYARFEQALQTQIDAELASRRQAERRVN